MFELLCSLIITDQNMDRPEQTQFMKKRLEILPDCTHLLTTVDSLPIMECYLVVGKPLTNFNPLVLALEKAS